MRTAAAARRRPIPVGTSPAAVAAVATVVAGGSAGRVGTAALTLVFTGSTITGAGPGVASSPSTLLVGGVVTTDGAVGLRIGAAVAATATTVAAGSVSAGGVSPTLLSRVVGIGDTSTGRVMVRTTSATSVRLKVGADTAVTTGVVYGSAVTPDANGNAHCTVTGLTAGTKYYYRVEMTNSSGGAFLDTATTLGSLRTAPAGAASFAVDLGSCSNALAPAAMTAIGNRDDDLFLHLGDFVKSASATSYADGTGTGIANFRTLYGDMIASSNHTAVLATRPTVYIPSDHDAMVNNSTAGTDATAWTNWNTTYREFFPTPTLPGGTTGCYYTFVWGRVRFVVTDTRSFKSAPSATDNSSKTALGTTQKAWVKSTINAATEPMIVVVNADPWVGAASAGEDSWLGYTTERTEMANFYAGTGKKIIMTGGDMHAVAADDGTNSPGGVPIFHASPLTNNASQKGGPYTVGPYPASGTTVVSQYGRIVFTDDGATITAAFTGYSSDNTARVSLSVSVDTVPAMPVGNLPADAVAPDGWTQVLAEDWNTDVAAPNWPTAYPDWLAYPDASGWDNNHTTFYYGGKGITVSGGILKTRCFYEASTGKYRTDTIRPPIGKGRQQLYGVYEIAYRVPQTLPGYKQAWLLWPADNIGSHGEIDFPESGFESTEVIHGYVHRADGVAGNATSYTSTTTTVGTDWHVCRIVWSPNRVQFYLDGVLVKDYTSSTLVLSQEGTWRIQTEGNLTGTTPLITPGAPEATGIDQATDGYVEIAYCAVWTRNAATAKTTGATVAPAATLTAAGSAVSVGSSAATVAATSAVTAAGTVARSTGATVAASASVTAAGAIPGAGPAFVKLVGTNAISASTTTISVTVPAGGVAAGNTVMLVPNGNGVGTPASASDSRGNTYTIDRTSTSTTGGAFVSGYITTALQAGDTITFVGNTSIASRTLIVAEFSGVAAPPAGDQSVTTPATAATSVTSAATPTTTQAVEVLIGFYGTSGSTNLYSSIAAGWTEIARVIGASRTELVAYQIVTSTGGYTFGGTTSSAVDQRAAIQTYKTS